MNYFCELSVFLDFFNGAGPREVMMLFDFEPNNVFDTAISLDPGVYSISGIGDDWYHIEGSPGEIDIIMQPDEGKDINMVLYNSNNQVVASNFSSGTERIKYSSSSSEGYYLQVYPTSSNASKYTLTIDVPQGAWSKVLNLGPIRDVSVALYDIDGDGKDEIFVGTSKALDQQMNEVRPAGLAVLNSDGSLKWTVSFPAIEGPDSQTGKLYSTTSVTTAPAFADINGDGSIDIVVGVGGDSFGDAGSNVVGQPGDKGGIYALDKNGNILWFHQSKDMIGGATNTGDGRPDGVYGSPVVFDIDGDGVREVIVGSWDQSLWVLDGRNGAVEKEIHLADTIWSTPRIADITGDNRFEMLISADITANAHAGTTTGGIFHVIGSDGSQNVPGFDRPVGNPSYLELRGKWEEQSLWSSPVTADIDGDGNLEIVYGTGNYFHDHRGQYVRVWEHDGTEKFQLSTLGRTMATPLVADLDGDGRLELVAATLDGYVHAWDQTGRELFAVRPTTFGGNGSDPIFSAPLAVDLTGDGRLEILISKGAQTVVLSHDGQQLTSSTRREFIFEQFKGAPAVKDIDGDGRLEIISGGTTPSKDQAIVYRWDNPYGGLISEFTNARYQFHQSQSNIIDFVERFYLTVLGRDAEAGGRNDWVDRLATGIAAGAEVAQGFIFSEEFTAKQMDDEAYVEVLYRAFFNRHPDLSGFQDWVGRLVAGVSRAEVLSGFIYSQEFKNLCSVYSIIPARSV